MGTKRWNHKFIANFLLDLYGDGHTQHADSPMPGKSSPCAHGASPSMQRSASFAPPASRCASPSMQRSASFAPPASRCPAACSCPQGCPPPLGPLSHRPHLHEHFGSMLRRANTTQPDSQEWRSPPLTPPPLPSPPPHTQTPLSPLLHR